VLSDRPEHAPATINDEGLANAKAANPFRLPRLHPGIRSAARLPYEVLRIASGGREPHIMCDETSDGCVRQ
jgi:hypothetical protein